MKEITQKIQYIDIQKLKPHPENPRLIKDDQFKILKDSIKDNPGYFETRPILVNKDLVIFAGNMRYRAAQDLGMKEVPVSIMDISPEKERELLIRDNVQNGEWQINILANAFDVGELSAFGVGPEVTGLFEGNGPPPAASDCPCERCADIRSQIDGHEKRAGHKFGSLE